MKFRHAITAALFGTIVVASGASAQGVNTYGQSWQNGWTAGTQVNEFWNNASHDGATCNIGFFVANTSFGPCSNEIPASFPAPLGWVNAAYLSTTVPTTTSTVFFDFQPGSYRLTFLGQVAGAVPPRFMGITSSDGSNTISQVFAPAVSTIDIIADRAFKFYLQAYAPGTPPVFNSMAASPQQFAIFANSNGGDPGLATQWLVGSEDNSCRTLGGGCTALADYDYNDGLVLVENTTVPEPSTYALMAFGLLAVGGAARRRAAKLA